MAAEGFKNRAHALKHAVSANAIENNTSQVHYALKTGQSRVHGKVRLEATRHALYHLHAVPYALFMPEWSRSIVWRDSMTTALWSNPEAPTACDRNWTQAHHHWMAGAWGCACVNDRLVWIIITIWPLLSIQHWLSIVTHTCIHTYELCLCCWWWRCLGIVACRIACVKCRSQIHACLSVNAYPHTYPHTNQTSLRAERSRPGRSAVAQ